MIEAVIEEKPRPPRIPLIDVMRGVALVAMMIFHGAWDVSYFRLLRFDPSTSPGWIVFARVIAASFLALAGIGLVLATRGGFRRGPYLRRLLRIVAAAALVSAATWFALPQGWVFFGILHQIALASVLALPFLAMPTTIVALVAAAVIALPQFFRAPIFAEPALWWVGLAPVPPPSFDYVPVFPWFGAVLGGIVLARLAIARGLDVRLAAFPARRQPARLLAFAGRHSLAVYLIHQPVLYGFFFALSHFLLPGTAAQAARADCVDRCVEVRGDAVACGAYCGCVFDDLERTGLIRPLLADTMTEADTERLRGTAMTCTATTLAPLPGEDTMPAAPEGGPP